MKSSLPACRGIEPRAPGGGRRLQMQVNLQARGARSRPVPARAMASVGAAVAADFERRAQAVPADREPGRSPFSHGEEALAEAPERGPVDLETEAGSGSMPALCTNGWVRMASRAATVDEGGLTGYSRKPFWRSPPIAIGCRFSAKPMPLVQVCGVGAQQIGRDEFSESVALAAERRRRGRHRGVAASARLTPPGNTPASRRWSRRPRRCRSRSRAPARTPDR